VETRRLRLTARLGLLGLATVLTGGILLGTSMIAGAATPAVTMKVTTSASGVCGGATCSKLAGGDVISVSGSGFAANQLATILECSSDPSQPVVLYLGVYAPISCSKIVIVATSTTGTFGPSNFTVVAGVTGPPATPYAPTCTESSTASPTTTSTIPNCTTSGNETTDAAAYPCPPTAAQQAAGDTCVIAIGDISGQRAAGTILFGSETLPSASTTTTTTTAAPTTTTTAAPTTTTTAAPTTTTTAAPISLTGAYELFCPGTPIGNVVINDAVTTATLSPPAPSAGQAFSVTGYQTVVNLPQTLAVATVAIQPNLEGAVTAQIDASGATPATTPQGPFNFNIPIPSPVPAAGMPLSLPATPAAVSGFTATNGAITIEEDSATSMSLTLGGSALSLSCSTYANDSVTPSGVTAATPSGDPIAPVIAVAGGGSTTTTVPPAGPTTTAPADLGGGGNPPPAAKVVTAPSSSLAFTGPGRGVGILGVVGAALIILGFALLVLVDVPRRVMSRLVYRGPASWRHAWAGQMPENSTAPDPAVWSWSPSEGVPDTTIMTSAPLDLSVLSGSVTEEHGIGDRFSRVPAASRDLVQTTARYALRTVQWFLGH